MKKLLATITILVSTFSHANECITKRAAFDIGSGSTKMKVYKVNHCLQTIIEQVDKDHCKGKAKISYKQDVIDYGYIRKETLIKGVNALTSMVETAKSCGADQFSGVATSAFRQAINGNSSLIEFKSVPELKVTKISQEQEAKLGYIGAVLKSNLSDKELATACSWDIGGSSMQIVCNNHGKKSYFFGQLASEPFRDIVRASKTTSPNPLGKDGYARGVASTKIESSYAKQSLGHDLSNRVVIGIGGVHFYSLSKALKLKTYNTVQLAQSLSTMLFNDDDTLGGGDYVDTAVSNILLVQQMMDQLNVSAVRALDVNLTEGLSVSNEYW